MISLDFYLGHYESYLNHQEKTILSSSKIQQQKEDKNQQQQEEEDEIEDEISFLLKSKDHPISLFNWKNLIIVIIAISFWIFLHTYIPHLKSFQFFQSS